tara:strand:- start:2103 stop:2831 length:729 start_codon:yes stop_codon:yes gene_type:complete
MTEKIAILLPTRKRSNWLKRFWVSVQETARYPAYITMYLYIDDDDLDGITAARTLSKAYPNNVFYMVGKRIMMSEMPNKLFAMTSDENIMFLAGDDLVMRTKHWDRFVVEAFDKIPDRLALVYGVDGGETQHPPDFATHPIIHRKWFDVLGYINPPYFSCDYADTWLNDLADSVGRKFLIPIYNEHMHFTLGKGEFDDTYLDGRKRFAADNVPKVFSDLKETKQKDIQKIKDYIKDYTSDDK